VSPSPSIDVRFDASGLVPAIIQDVRSRQVLMVGYMNEEALARTRSTGLAWFFSRSRGRLWQKGETSGHVLRVARLTADCDGDAVLVEAIPDGPTCHSGAVTCFHHPVCGDRERSASEVAAELLATVKQRHAERPQGSYVAKLFDGGVDRIAKKVGEEASEVIIAAKNANPDELRREMADLWFHCYVLLVQAGLEPEDVWRELELRRR
jgi:phosphoribosyl-ATP pyrophosphohydrolase/phosphoribosyl-AMP cyclohydrolase